MCYERELKEILSCGFQTEPNTDNIATNLSSAGVKNRVEIKFTERLKANEQIKNKKYIKKNC